MWWAHGLRNRSDDGRLLRCIQTGRYGLAIDVETAELVRLGPIKEPISYRQAVAQSNDVVLSLPQPKLELLVRVDGIEYRCQTTGVKKQGWAAARVIESGRFLQRFDILNLQFADADGNQLAATGRLEVIAWPDRLGMVLEVEPLASSKPDEVWKNASPVIRLAHDGVKQEAQLPKEQSETWPVNQKRAVSISLLPGAKQIPASVDSKHITATDVNGGKKSVISGNQATGWCEIDLDQIRPLGEHNDAIERVTLRLENPSAEPKVARLLFKKGGGGFRVRGISALTGISPMLRDSLGNPTGIPVQISKNWHRKQGEFALYQGPWFHGFSMLRLPPNSRVECELTLAYAHWGGLPAASHAQLSLIGWGSNQLWDESALGAWGESICFEPDQGQRGGAVLDTRPLMVWALKNDEKRKWNWTNNVGGADFLVYYDSKGNKQWNSRMRTAYRRYGPCQTEVTYAGRSADSKIDLQTTVGIYRSDDIVRGVYRFRYDVRKEVDFSQRTALYE